MANIRKKKPALPLKASEIKASDQPGGDAIAKLAYELWLRRGSPDGSPEQDWYEAERILKGSAESMGTPASEEISAKPRSRRSKATAAGA
jgi:hypothetical protein